MILPEGPLQFGVRLPGQSYPDRPAAFGVAVRDGKVAVARITRTGEPAYLDLPGGGIDPGETPAAAMVREFGEEVALAVRPGRLLLRASQYMIKGDRTPANNLSSLFEAEIIGEAASLKIEADHELAWLDPREAVVRLRHESHAWAVAAWLRARG